MSDVDLYYELWCRSRMRQAIQMPPFRWRDLLHWYGWRVWVLSRLRKGRL